MLSTVNLFYFTHFVSLCCFRSFYHHTQFDIRKEKTVKNKKFTEKIFKKKLVNFFKNKIKTKRKIFYRTKINRSLWKSHDEWRILLIVDFSLLKFFFFKSLYYDFHSKHVHTVSVSIFLLMLIVLSKMQNLTEWIAVGSHS